MTLRLEADKPDATEGSFRFTCLAGALTIGVGKATSGVEGWFGRGDNMTELLVEGVLRAGDNQLFLAAVEVWSSPRPEFGFENNPPDLMRFKRLGGLEELAFRAVAAAKIDPAAEGFGVGVERAEATEPEPEWPRGPVANKEHISWAKNIKTGEQDTHIDYENW